jgi:hypothetical protein
MIREANARTETRDAILWAVYPDERYVTVKIQGSSTAIPANYPENWHQTPPWLKPGNAVKVMHTAGNRNRIELVGHGLSVPTPIDSTASAPTLEEGPDTVMTDMQVRPVTNTSVMKVWVDHGTYRINNTTYTFGDSLTMTSGSDIVMGSAVYLGSLMTMGSVGSLITIDAAHATAFRYDIISVGADGVLDYTKGTAHATNPQIPDTPADHARVCFILIPPGTTEITSDLINRYYVTPFVSQLEADPTSLEMDWETSSDTITINVMDQYGNGITGQRWIINAEITSGSGSVTSSVKTGSSTYSADFTYTREADYDSATSPATETGPVHIEFSLVQNSGATMLIPVILYDETGDIIT